MFAENRIGKGNFPAGSVVKNLPAKQETQVQSLGWEDPLEKGMATHSSILAWSIPWTEEPGWLQSMGFQRVGHDLTTKQQQRGKDSLGRKGAASRKVTGAWLDYGGPCRMK